MGRSSLPDEDSIDRLQNPVINGPYDPPTQYFVVGPQGPTGELRAGRRPSESFIPIPRSKKRGKANADATALEFDFDSTGERREVNSLINQLRSDVELWRAREYEHVTHISRKLLLTAKFI